MSPREYQARLDLLKVQDCVWARMKPSEIARKLGKDKAWVSRAIRKLETERASAYRSVEESELIGENLQQIESLLAKALAIGHANQDAKTQLAALRTASDLLKQKTDYEVAVGLIRSRKEGEGLVDKEKAEAAVELYDYIQEQLPPTAVAAILARREESRRRRNEQAQMAGRGAN